MPGNRRHFLQSMALAAQAPAVDRIRTVAAAHGVVLTDERLRVLAPILDQSQASLRKLRDLVLEATVAPTPGIG